MSATPTLRSPYESLAGTVFLPRMLDKIRLHQRGELPAEYQPFLGNRQATGFDARCCRFLSISYDEVTDLLATGADDDSFLHWLGRHGCARNTEEQEIFNAFLQKRGWRDSGETVLQDRIRESGRSPAKILTFFDLIDDEEGRPLRFGPNPPVPSAPLTPTVSLPKLRSPFDQTEGVVHFGRMLDKIRLFLAGQLPDPWHASRGADYGFDGILCRFLGTEYAEVERLVRDGASDVAVWDWIQAHGTPHSAEEKEIFNAYLIKRGWRDQYQQRLEERLAQAGMPANAVSTMFDFIDRDEGR